MTETPPPACPTCSTPYDGRHNKQHCTSPTCDWIRCGTPDCGTTYHPQHADQHMRSSGG